MVTLNKSPYLIENNEILTTLVTMELFGQICDKGQEGPRQITIPFSYIDLLNRVLSRLIFEGLSEHERAQLFEWREKHKSMFRCNSVVE